MNSRIVEPDEFDGQLLAALRAMTAERDALRAENERLRDTNTALIAQLKALVTTQFPPAFLEQTKDWRRAVWVLTMELDRRLNPRPDR